MGEVQLQEERDAIGGRLRRIRKERGFTQKKLVEVIKGKIDYSYIGKIERGEQLPSIKVLKRISDALSVPLGYFFHNTMVSTLMEIANEDIKDIAGNENKRSFLKAAKMLHDDDVPLIREIIDVLIRHRNGGILENTEELLLKLK